jgi:hypothetical protein
VRALGQKRVAEVGTEKAGSSGDEDVPAFAIVHRSNLSLAIRKLWNEPPQVCSQTFMVAFGSKFLQGGFGERRATA